MHFIELVFGVSPDSGSGATEVAYVAAIAAGAALLAWMGRGRRRRSPLKKTAGRPH